MAKCNNCKKGKAIMHARLGVLPCRECQDKVYAKPNRAIEFTTDEIKWSRSEYGNDIEQIHRKGELNKKWVDLYGAKAAKDRGFSDKEIKNAKYVYSGDLENSYYKEV